jgi:diguanylate cyclase (GGDEF)-like protein/PAS domain S-box-containing protein
MKFNPLRRLLAMLGAFALLILVVWLLPPMQALKGVAHYLPLHMFLETFAIVVAMLVFAVGWNAYDRELPGNLRLLSVAFLGVGLLDFLHLLSYQGMPDFFGPGNPEKAIDFWLAARLLAASALLGMSLLPWRRGFMERLHYPLLAGVLALVAGFAWARLFHEEWFPHTFIPGEGLTPFKVGVEYLIISLCLIAAARFYRLARQAQTCDCDALHLFAAVGMMALSEFLFTLYGEVTDLYNLLGHVYKAISYLFIYRAIFVSAVQTPYRRLSESRQALRESADTLKEERVFLQSIIDAVPDPLVVIRDNYQILLMNRAAHRHVGQSRENIEGLLCRQAFRPPGQDAPWCIGSDEYCPMQAVRSRKRPVLLHREYQDRQGGRHIIEVSAAPLLDRNGQLVGIVESSRDVTERHQIQEQLLDNQQRMTHLAYHDALTDLPNRRLFQDRLEHAIHKSQRSQARVAVLFLDLDRFKNINDTLSHAVGDRLLKMVAERLKQCVREGDTVARLGGDEFTVLLEEVEQVETVAHVAQRIVESLARPFVLDYHELYIGTSIGVSLYPEDGADTHSLIRNADSAMYLAKSRGRGNYQFFTEELNRKAIRQLELETNLRKAFNSEELQVFYQPQINPRDGVVEGMEALIRWPTARGFIPPDEFIPLAEENGFIVPLGDWVMRTACRQAAQWRQQGLGDLRVAVNLSAQQFQQQNLVQRVENALKESGLPPHLLELELTESILLGGADSTIGQMNRLRELGVGMAIDDFGTGYSSLTYLKQFPLDHLKVAQEFVKDLSVDPNDAAIARAIISLAQNLGIEVIAEGVESAAHLAFFQKHGCDLVQGYFFSPALRAEAFTLWLKNWRERRTD